VLEGEVDDAVGLRRRLPEPLQVIQISSADLGAEGGDRLGRGVRAGQADDLMAVA
jgi:hypothetical protein